MMSMTTWKHNKNNRKAYIMLQVLESYAHAMVYFARQALSEHDFSISTRYALSMLDEQERPGEVAMVWSNAATPR